MSEMIAKGDSAARDITSCDVAVIGAGAFGTALAGVLAENMPEREIRLWAHEKAVALNINSSRQNETWLPGVMLPDNITAIHNAAQALEKAGVVFLAVPSRFFVSVLEQIVEHLGEDTQLVSTCRGFVRYNDAFMLPSECVALIAPGHAVSFSALNGPAHALEVGKGFHTRLMFGAASTEYALRAAALVECGYISTEVTDDLRGVELAAALKGPLGIAGGILSMLPHCGDNMLGILFGEGLREMNKLAGVFGVDPQTLAGPAGAGDLVASLASEHCRNRRFGRELVANAAASREIRRPFLVRLWSWFRRRSVIAEQAERNPYLVEGLFAIEPVIEAARREGLDVPVFQALHTILGGHPDHYLLLHAVTSPEDYNSFYEQYRVRSSTMLPPDENSRSVIQKQALERTLHVFGEPAKAARLRQYPGMSGEMSSTLLEQKARTILKDFMRTRLDLYGPVRRRLIFAALWAYNFVLHLFRRRRGRAIFSRNFRLVYDRTRLDPVLESSRLVYLAAGETAQDAVACLYALWRGGLPLPRVFWEGAADFKPRTRAILRHCGLTFTDPGDGDDLLYREYIRQYMMLLLEQDIPVSLFMETKEPGDATVEPLSYRMLRYPVELFHHLHPDISIVPLQASHMFAPARSGSGDELDFRHMFLNAATVNVSQPVPLAVYAYRRNAPRDIGRRVRQQWCESAWLYEHYLVCAVFEEGELQLAQKELKKRLRDLLSSAFPTRSYVPGDVYAKGISFLKRAEVVLVREGVVSIIDQQQIEYYASRVQCMISEKSVSRNI